MRRGASTLAILCVAAAAWCTPTHAQFDPSFDPPLAVDVNPDPDIFETNLVAAPITWEFIPGVPTQALAYNGSVPGPMIDVKVGDTLIVHFTNNLGEPTTIHWHGVDAPADMDGSHIAQLWVQDGETFTYQFKLLTPGLKWYHPHVRTAYMVEHGLYGALLVRDAANDAVLGIPGDQHVIMFDDIKLDDATGEFDNFEPTADPLVWAIYQLNGRRGNHLVMNGRESSSYPVLPVANGQPQHWWVVNVSNATFCHLDLNKYYKTTPAVVGDPVEKRHWLGPVWQIGGDRGYIEHPMLRDRIVEVVPLPPAADSGGADHFIFQDFRGILLTPGERMEVSFTPYGEPGQVLPVDQWDWARGDHIAFYNPDGTIGLGDDPLDGFHPVLNYFRMQLVGPNPGTPYYAPPADLVPLAEVLDPLEATNTVNVTFGHAFPDAAGNVTFFAQLYGGMPVPLPKVTSVQAFDLNIGDTVYWEITNLTHGDHPFHTHGFPFQWYEVEYVDSVTPSKNYKQYPTDNGGSLQNKDTLLVPARPGAKGTSKTIMRAMMKIDDTGRTGRVTAAGGHGTSAHSGGWLYHCHILEHAKGGMMSWFEVRDPNDPFANVGGGSASPAGLYSDLSGMGLVQAGQRLTIQLAEATPGVPTYLVAGAPELFVPKDGALFVPTPNLIFGPFATDGGGTVAVPGTWPGLPLGASISMQFWTQEGGGVLSASNGMRITQL